MIPASSGPPHSSAAFRAGLAVYLAVVIVAVGLLFAVHPWDTGGSVPSDFGAAAYQRTSPGSIGCRSTPAEICYAVAVDSSFSNLPASNLVFAVSNHFPTSYPIPSTVPLGPGASVSLLSSTQVVGVWNCTFGTWTQVPQNFLPTTSAFVIVLDTGLGSNTTLNGSYFYVEHSLPYGGATGIPLWWP